MKLDPQPRIPGDLEGMRFAVSTLIRRVNDTVNALIEGRAAAIYTAVDALPSSGTYAKGDYLHNSNPSELGAASSKYIVYGWKRLTSGSGNVLNTDWFEDRRLTGN